MAEYYNICPSQPDVSPDSRASSTSPSEIWPRGPSEVDSMQEIFQNLPEENNQEEHALPSTSPCSAKGNQPQGCISIDVNWSAHGPTKTWKKSWPIIFRQSEGRTPFYHASLIERPDAPSDQHAVSAMNDDDQGPLMCGSVAAALFSATAFAAARLYCSVIVLNRTRREDVIILLSLIFLWAGCILTILAVVSGMGKHVDTLTVEQMANARFYYLVSVWPALLAITVPKVAVAGLIIRIFTPDVWTKTIMSGVVCVGVLNYIVISALSTFQCQPLAAAWDPRVRAAKCVSAKIYLDLCYFTSSYSASVDCYLAIYPTLVFRKMGFSIIKKIGLSVVLGLGIGVTAVACLKISYLHVLSNADFTWTIPRLTIWTITEATVTIVAACIPVLHPLYDRARSRLRKVFPSLRRQANDQGTTGSRPEAQGPHAADSPGFWSLKLRALALAESWWTSTAGRTSRRSGVRGTQAEEEHTGRPASTVTGMSGVDDAAAVVVHSEGAARQSDIEQSRDLIVLTEVSLMEREPDLVIGHDPDANNSEHTTVVGQKQGQQASKILN